MSDCLFCKISAKKIPAKIVYEDADALAFEDMNPQAPVHVLIIPRKHIATPLEMTAEDESITGHLFLVAAKITRDKGIDESGFRLVLNTNADAGQGVFHMHLHLLGGRRMHWPPG